LPVSLYASIKGFSGDGRAQIWNVRRLIHALRGSQVSFYLPTFFQDIEVETDLASGSFNMDIVHAGYTDYVNAQEPNASVWIELTNSTIITREIQSATEVDSDTERLVVGTAWGSTITPAEISRVSFLRLVRIADDQVQFTHKDIGDAEITMNVVGVRQ
jgi:hypothetical protein